jgi:hypothetical protein
VGAGVIQGGVLSPSLFNIMINDLIEELSQEGYEVYAYADDLAVVAQGQVALLKLLDITQRWTEKNKMLINKKKSAIMYLQKTRGRRRKTLSELEGYPIKESYKYLGVVIDDRLNFKAHLELIRAKI